MTQYLPIRVEHLIAKRRIEHFSNFIQILLKDMENMPAKEALMLNNLIQLLGKSIEIANQEFKGRASAR